MMHCVLCRDNFANIVGESPASRDFALYHWPVICTSMGSASGAHAGVVATILQQTRHNALSL